MGLLLIFYIIFFIPLVCSDERKTVCGNVDCKVSISMAKTSHRYIADANWKISFEPGQRANILAKYQDGNMKLFKVNIGGRIGWAPATGLQEYKVLIVKDKLVQVPLPKEIESFESVKNDSNLQTSEISPSENETKESTTPLPAYTQLKIVTKKPDPVVDANPETVNTAQSKIKEVPVEKLNETIITEINHFDNTSENLYTTTLSNESLSNVEETENFNKSGNEHTAINRGSQEGSTVNASAYTQNYSSYDSLESDKVSSMKNINSTGIKYKIKNETFYKSDLRQNTDNKDDNAEYVNDNLNLHGLKNVLSSADVSIDNSVPDEHNLGETNNISTINSTDLILEKNILSSSEINMDVPQEQVNENIVEQQIRVFKGKVKNRPNDLFHEKYETQAKEKENKVVSNKSESEKNQSQHFNEDSETSEGHYEKISEKVIILTHQKEANVSQTKNKMKLYDYIDLMNNHENQTKNISIGQNILYKEIEQKGLNQENKHSLKGNNVNENLLKFNSDKQEIFSSAENGVNENLLKFNSDKQEVYNSSIESSDLIKHEYDNNSEAISNNEPTSYLNQDNIYNTASNDTVIKSNFQLNDLEIPTEGNEFHHRSQNAQTDNYIEISNVSEISFISTVYKFVNSMLSSNFDDLKTNQIEKTSDENKHEILFSNGEENIKENNIEYGHCEKVDPISCPAKKLFQHGGTKLVDKNVKHVIEHNFFHSLYDKVLEMINFLLCLAMTALTSLVFAFGYYCISHSRRENDLLHKLNVVERNLLASTKEAMVLKHELIETKAKNTNIENSSFGPNDMVIGLKKELECREEKERKLQEQITLLEKELESAAEAGLELNKIVSELLSNQSGDDSILSTVEELQKQLNEQRNTSIQINTMLTLKSQENKELQLLLSETTSKFQEEISNLRKQNENLDNDKKSLDNQIKVMENNFSEQLFKIDQEKSTQINALNDELVECRMQCNAINDKLQASEIKAQILEECLNSIKKNPNMNIEEFVDVAGFKAENLVLKKEKEFLKERLEAEMDTRKLLEDRIKTTSQEVNKLKQEFNQSEKEKLEAITRLNVLSAYFKEKETQLKKELSVKEAQWLKQQGETTSTVERVRLMQDEILSLRSQNDSLRAEIEAQNSAHKVQIATLENHTHETWLAARQSERKYEEARYEAASLRRKLTSISTNPTVKEMNLYNQPQSQIDGLMNEKNDTSSPIHMESSNSPMLGGLPPPPPFLPPLFMAPPHPFMPLPSPVVSPGQMRPPPLGRLMSPPPPPHGYSANISDDEKHRYSPDNDRYSPSDSRYECDTDMVSEYDIESDSKLTLDSHVKLRDVDRGRHSSRGKEWNFRSSKLHSNNFDRKQNKKGNNYSDSEEQCSGW